MEHLLNTRLLDDARENVVGQIYVLKLLVTPLFDLFTRNPVSEIFERRLVTSSICNHYRTTTLTLLTLYQSGGRG